MLLSKWRLGQDVFTVETIPHEPDYRVSVGRADAPHVFNVEAERAEEIQRHLLLLDSEGWERVK